MRKKAIINVPGKYAGGYAAFGKEGQVIAGGQDLNKVIEEARAKGCKVPAIAFIRDPNVTYIW